MRDFSSDRLESVQCEIISTLGNFRAIFLVKNPNHDRHDSLRRAWQNPKCSSSFYLPFAL